MAPDADPGPANGWWKEFLEVIPDGYQDLISAEEDATGIVHFHPTFIPGLLQTERYASAITLATTLKTPTSAEAMRLVQVRMLRQRSAFDPTHPKRLRFLLDERCLHRRVGSVTTMHEQLSHLRTMCARPDITVGVLPLDTGPHPGLLGPFMLLDYDGGVGTVLCFEWQLGNSLERDPDRIGRYQALATDLLARATDTNATTALIDSALRELPDGRDAGGTPAGDQIDEPTDGGSG